MAPGKPKTESRCLRCLDVTCGASSSGFAEPRGGKASEYDSEDSSEEPKLELLFKCS